MFAAVRIKKFGAKAVGHLQEHNERTKPQLHTDPSKTHLNKFKLFNNYPNFVEAVADKVKTLAVKQKRKPRSDAVMLVDVVLIASPEFFRPGRVEEWGAYDEEPLKAYTAASLEFLKKRFGDRVISISLHLDECTPHISAAVVPITPDGRLSGKDMFNKFELSKLQDQYADAMKHLGLRRGIKNSKKEHTEAKEYYQQNTELKTQNSKLTDLLKNSYKSALNAVSAVMPFLTKQLPPAKPLQDNDWFENQLSPIFPVSDIKTKLDRTSKVDPKSLDDDSTQNAVKNSQKMC